MSDEKKLLVKLTDVSKIYKNGSVEVSALRQVDLSIREGEILGVMGKSGSGKTTMLNILSLVMSATSGQYLFDGCDVTTLKEKKRIELRRTDISVIYQDYALIQELTVRENLHLPYIIAGKKVDESRISEIASQLGLLERMDFFPMQLSGGEQQRTSIARAMVLKPKLLLADEPTGNLDSENAEAVMKMLVGVAREQGCTVVFVTHDSDMAAFADRVVTIKDGVILALT